MTQQQRRATRNALARYGQRGYRQTFEGRGWSLAIEQALSYYDQTDPIRARLLRMRYFEHRSIEDVMEQLNLSYSTYQKSSQRPVEHHCGLRRPQWAAVAQNPRTANGCRGLFDASGILVGFRLLTAVVVVAGGTVAAAALPFPAALLGDPDHDQPKQDGQDQNGDNSANRHKK